MSEAEDPRGTPPEGVPEPEGAPGPEGLQEGISEEELRARLEEELRRITVRDILVQTVVSLVNLAGQRLGLAPETKDLKDLGQVRTAIDAVRALLPLLEEEEPEQVRPIRDALAQLQMAYAREMGTPPPPPAAPEGGKPGPSPGEQGRRGGPGGLWVPPGSTS